MPLELEALRNAITMASRVVGVVLSSTLTEAKAVFATFDVVEKLVSVLRDVAFFIIAAMTCRCRAARPKSPCGSE